SPTIATSIHASARWRTSTTYWCKPIGGGLRFCLTSYPTTHPTGTHGLSRAGLRKIIRREAGTSGAILPLTGDHPTTGSAISADQPVYGTIFLPRLPEGTTRPQLASSSRAGGDVRCDAVLVRPWRRWLPHRRAVAHAEGGRLPGQSAQPGLSVGNG